MRRYYIYYILLCMREKGMDGWSEHDRGKWWGWISRIIDIHPHQEERGVSERANKDGEGEKKGGGSLSLPPILSLPLALQWLGERESRRGPERASSQPCLGISLIIPVSRVASIGEGGAKVPSETHRFPKSLAVPKGRRFAPHARFSPA